MGRGTMAAGDATVKGVWGSDHRFPADDLAAMVSHLEYLAKKALPHSREKHAFGAFTKDHAGTGCASL